MQQPDAPLVESGTGMDILWESCRNARRELCKRLRISLQQS